MGGYNLTYSPALWQAKFYLLQQASRLPHYIVYSGAEVDEGARVDEGGKVVILISGVQIEGRAPK